VIGISLGGLPPPRLIFTMRSKIICQIAFEVLKVQTSIQSKMRIFNWVVPFIIPFFLIYSYFLFELIINFSYLYLYSTFLLCLILFSQAKFYAFAYLDIIHLFPWGINKIKKRMFIFFSNLLGLKLAIFVGFGSVLIFKSSMLLVDFIILFLFYAVFVSLDIVLLEQSLRVKVVRVMYKYLYILFLTFCFLNTRFFAFIFINNPGQVNLHTRADLWYQENRSMILCVLFIALLGNFLISVLKDNWFPQHKPFIQEFNDYNKFF
jgi:hypothetical protein